MTSSQQSNGNSSFTAFGSSNSPLGVHRWGNRLSSGAGSYTSYPSVTSEAVPENSDNLRVPGPSKQFPFQTVVAASDMAVVGYKSKLKYLIVEFASDDDEEEKERHFQLILRGFICARTAHFRLCLGKPERLMPKKPIVVMAIFVSRKMKAYRYLFTVARSPPVGDPSKFSPRPTVEDPNSQPEWAYINPEVSQCYPHLRSIVILTRGFFLESRTWGVLHQ